MRTLLTYLLLLLASVTVAQTRNSGPRYDVPSDELRVLNQAIRHASRYDNRKTETIDSLKKIYAGIPVSDISRRWELTYEIARQYLTNNADSALRYANRSLQLSGDVLSRQIRSRLAVVNGLSMAGIFSHALSKFDSISQMPLDKDQKLELWRSGRQLYSYMMTYVSEDSPIYKEYNQRYLAFDDSLLNNLPRTDNFYTFLRGERAVGVEQYKEAKVYLESLLERLTPESNLYGMAAYQMAQVYLSQGDETGYAAYLAKAAVSDIQGAVKEGLALPALATWLYNQGRLDDAFEYITFALEGASSGNARMRSVAIAPMVPVIDQAYRKEIRSSRDRMVVWFCLACVLLILSGVLLFAINRQAKQSREAQRKLEKLSKMQESYIGNFVGLCSSYADRLESLSKLVAVKISSGKTDELLKLVKSGRFGEPGKDEDFYRSFDSAFLDLYPDFVMRVNMLLREDEQIVLKKGEGLSPELRIYAFVKLGVEESTRIAQILHYSVSTIYAYRNKMRNKAVSRDTFEADVAAIRRH